VCEIPGERAKIERLHDALYAKLLRVLLKKKNSPNFEDKIITLTMFEIEIWIFFKTQNKL
jgi:hypothetical protein